MHMPHKAGFVNIVGNPNVGKSTIMNALTGENLSVITSRAQTTRHRILGIVNGEDFQIVYSDTPGIIKPGYRLQEYMLKFSRSALVDGDIILYVTDVKEKPLKNMDFIERLKKIKVPVFLVINKIDLGDENTVTALIAEWSGILPRAVQVPMSATEKFNLDKLLSLILENLPESPPFYPKNELTDKSERFFAAETIRGKILQIYRKEVPYSVEVEIESFRETAKLIRISSIIYVERESQKGILIGHQGKALKKVGTLARKDMEEFFGKQIFLETLVKVKKDWRNDDRTLKEFGYRTK